MTRRLLLVPFGALVGAALGVAARAWMRLISDDPEFSWSGTWFIIGAFTVFGTAQGIARVGLTSRRRWVSSTSRAFGAVGTMPLFVGAGAVMLPTVVAGGFARHRPTVRTWARVLLVAIAGLPIVMVTRDVHDDFGWSLHTLAGVAAMVAVYAAVIALARPTFAANPRCLRVPRGLIAVGVAALGLAIVFLTAGFVFTG